MPPVGDEPREDAAFQLALDVTVRGTDVVHGRDAESFDLELHESAQREAAIGVTEEATEDGERRRESRG